MQIARVNGVVSPTFSDRYLNGQLGIFILLGVICAFLLVLLGVVLGRSVVVEGEEGLTLYNFKRVLETSATGRILFNTFMIGIGTVFVTLVIGLPLTWLVQRTDLPAKSFIIASMVAGIAIPGFIRAIGYIVLFSPRIGLTNQAFMNLFGTDKPIFNIYTLYGISLAMGVLLVPLAFFLLSGAMRSMDPALEDAARSCGASTIRVLRVVSFPLMFPGILMAGVYTFMVAIGIFEIPALLGAPAQIHVLSTEIFWQVVGSGGARPDYGKGAVYALFIMVPLLIALVFYYRTINAAYKWTTVRGKGYRPKIFSLGSWKYPCLAFVFGYLVLALFLPLLSVAWISLLPVIRMPSADAFATLTLDAYRQMWNEMGGFTPIKNTLFVMAVVPPVVFLISLIVSWFVLRSNVPGRQVVDSIIMLPRAVPSIVLAFGILTLSLWVADWVPIYGTLFILIPAFVVVFLPYGSRITHTALLQIHDELDKAAYVCGAGVIATLWKILLPLLKPALAYGVLWISLLTFREVTVPLMLSSPGTDVISVRVWSIWSGGYRQEIAAALATVMTVVIGVTVLLGHRVISRFLLTDR